VKGAETPHGSYRVQYKMPVARFRGVNPNGSRYDIPNVHWVLAFYEDYTIHGAYWRQVFGRPGSNGCISLTDPNAKVVYDFAEEGTRIEVHS
jgi:lipoprotein-anchoring transpeptidase ErfK/SrfK